MLELKIGDPTADPAVTGTETALDEDEQVECTRLFAELPPCGAVLVSAEVTALAVALAATTREREEGNDDMARVCSEDRALAYICFRSGIMFVALRQAPVCVSGTKNTSDLGLLHLYQHLVLSAAARASVKKMKEAKEEEDRRAARAAERRKIEEAMEARRRKRARVDVVQRTVVPPIASVRVALDPTMTYRIVARDHAVDLLGVRDDAVPLAHDLGSVPYFGPVRAMLSMRRADTGAHRAIWMERVPDFVESQPTGQLDLTPQGDVVE